MLKEGIKMNAKKIEEAAAACRNAELFIDECLKVVKSYEEEPGVRVKTFGFVSAAVDSMILARTNLHFCADRLYKSLDDMQGGEDDGTA